MVATDFLRVLIDWDRDGTWGHPLADVTGRVLEADWSYGFDAPEQLIAPPAGGRVVLDNSDGAFLPNQPGTLYGDLLQGDILIQFQHTEGTTRNGVLIQPYAISVLRILDAQIVPGTLGPRVVVLTLGDWSAELQSAIYDPPLTTNTTTGLAAIKPFQDGLMPLSYASQYWILDACTLDVDTTLFSFGQAYGAFYLGSTTLDYVGDNLDRGNGVSLQAYLEELCLAEMPGRFWLETWPGSSTYGPRPRWRYMGRTDIATYYSWAGTVTLPASRFLDVGSDYEYGRALCNSFEVTLYPRVIGAAGSELARNENPFRLRPGDSRQLTLRYRDPDFPDGTCAATTIITPVATTDYTANAASDGSGTDLTSSLGVGVENRTNAAYVTVNNNGADDLYVTLLKIRGTPMTARQPVTVKAIDAQSVYDYGFQRKAITIAGVADVDLVQNYANYYIQTHREPIARYRRVTFDFPENALDALYQPALNLPLSLSGIRIVDEWIEDPAQTRIHWVAGVRHSVSGTKWQTTWFLEDYVQQAFWMLDDEDLSVLDVSTRPAF